MIEAPELVDDPRAEGPAHRGVADDDGEHARLERERDERRERERDGANHLQTRRTAREPLRDEQVRHQAERQIGGQRGR